VTLSPQPLSAPALRQAVQAGSFDLALRLDPGAGYPDPRAWLVGYVGGATGGYEDPDFDALMSRADAALDSGHRVPLYQQAQRLLCQAAPSAFLCQAQALVMVRSTVGGVHPNGADDVPFVGDLDTPSIYLLE
jgi:ABC-type oligopeptide transport system substrate-binding subunit